jgi:hypothetical protein
VERERNDDFSKKERGAPEPAPEVREDVARDVRAEAGPTRCPFCHERVDVETEAWRACEACLARHHESCWNESGRCSSCGCERSVGRSTTERGADAWRARLVAIAADVGFPANLVRRETPLPRAGESVVARALLGGPPVIERTRALDRELPASLCGSWESPLVGIAIENEGGRATIRARLSMAPMIGGVYGGLGGGVVGGLGGGLSSVIVRAVRTLDYERFSGLDSVEGVVLAWFAFCVLLALALSRVVFGKFARAGERKADALLDAIERAASEPSPRV